MVDQGNRRQDRHEDHEGEQQDRPQKEIRHRQQDQRYDGQSVIHGPVATDRLHQRRQHCQRQVKQESIGGEEDGVVDARGQDLTYLAAGGERLAEIAG